MLSHFLACTKEVSGKSEEIYKRLQKHGFHQAEDKCEKAKEKAEADDATEEEAYASEYVEAKEKVDNQV